MAHSKIFRIFQLNKLFSTLIFAGIIPFCYLLLWVSPDRPGSLKSAGKHRRLALHFSLWYVVLFEIAVISFGLGGCLISASFYYLLPLAFLTSIASSIVSVEVFGMAIKGSSEWSDSKRIIIISVIALTVLAFSTIIALTIRTKSG